MKPYGYMNVYADGRKEFHYGIDNASVSNIPLYTAPRELSDEEITEILIEQGIAQRLKRSGNLCFWQEDADLYEFARAILKKASEKCT